MGERRLFALIAGFVLTSASPASAATVHVKNTHDHGKGSLRKALNKANSVTRSTVPAGHYELASGELVVDTEVKIAGAGASKTIIDANRDSRVMHIYYAAPGNVKISGLTDPRG